jgi:uncharacterized protein (UPF0332 family)
VLEKAKRNVAAARCLVAASFVDAAASRLYYALFQAAIHHFTAHGLASTDLGPYLDWKHSAVKNHVYRIRGSHSDARLFRDAYALRVSADYGPAPVEPRLVAELLVRVENFVREVAR